MNTNKDYEFIEFEIPAELLQMQEKGGIPSLEQVNEWYDNTNRNLYVNAQIDDGLIDYVVYSIRRWNIEDNQKGLTYDQRKPIKIFINSDGGMLAPTMHACFVIKKSKTPIYTICQSRAYSSAGLLLSAGHVRYCDQFSSYLLHDGGTGVSGNLAKVQDAMTFTTIQEKQVKEFVCSTTNITPQKYAKEYRKDWFMCAEDMLKYGVVDVIADEII